VTDLLIGASGQSQMRTNDHCYGAVQTVNPINQVWNNNQNNPGNKFRRMARGIYPLDKLAENGEWANSMALAFCNLAAATYTPKLVMVAKVAHPIESFISLRTRERTNLSIPEGYSNLAPLMYNQFNGMKRACRVAKKPCFDVFLWLQGEGNNRDSTKAYARKLVSVIRDLTNAGLITSKTPFLAGGVATIHPFYAEHKAAILSVAEQYKNVKHIDTNGLATHADNVHFTGPSIITLGQRYWNAFESTL
jgi:hypothetical protein